MARIKATPPRGILTMLLEEEIGAGVLLYTYDKPDGSTGGWTDDPAKPGSKYIPYSILNPLDGTTSSNALGSPGGVWSLPYSVTTYSASGKQVELQSDRIRRLSSEVERRTLDLSGESWTIIEVSVPTIGAVNKNSSGATTTYIQYDTIVFTLSKER